MACWEHTSTGLLRRHLSYNFNKQVAQFWTYWSLDTWFCLSPDKSKLHWSSFEDVNVCIKISQCWNKMNFLILAMLRRW